METRTVMCPSCGKSFEIGASIEKITCNFCGAMFELAPPAKDEQPNDAEVRDSRFYFDKAVNALTPKVTTALHIGDAFTKKKYPPFFNAYYREIYKSFKYFERSYTLCANGRSTLVTDYAEAFAAKIKASADTDDVNTLRGAKLENIIYLYIAFAIPSILKFKAEYSDALADAFLDTWNREHKKRKLGKTTFESLNASFRYKLCFITTAVCDTLGRPDNCYELESFRRFRDEYLLRQPGGEAQVQEYYMVAPLIVNAINASPDKSRVYRGIWDEHLSQCLHLYEDRNYEQCRRAYTDMVSILREQWL